MAKNKGGRPTMLSPELAEEVVRYLKLGCYKETAAAMVGVDRKTLHAWMKRGAKEKARRRAYAETLAQEREADKQRQRKPRSEERQRRDKRTKEHRKTVKREEPYVEFHDAVEKAIATAEVGDLATITQAAKGGHLLEKRVIKDAKGNETVVEKRSRPEWQAAAWKLERRNPKDWAQVRRVELSGDQENPVALTLADSAKAAYAAKRSRLKLQGANGHGANGSANGSTALLAGAALGAEAEEGEA